MSPYENEYEETIANLKQEKEDLEKQVSTLNERNRNQAMLLKRLESARQQDRNDYEAQISELKEALSQERIKTRRAANFQNSPLSPSASQRSVMPSFSTITPPRRMQSEGESRQVSKDDRKSWKDSTGGLTSSGNDRLGNTAQVQSALLGAAYKKKQRKENKGGFWSLFGPTEEDSDSESAKRDAALLKENEDSRKSILTKEIMQALEFNKRGIVEREQELLAREEVQRVKEEAIRKNNQTRRLSEKLSSSFGLLTFSSGDLDIEGDDDEDNTTPPATPDQVNMNNIRKIRDSEVLDVNTLRRLIADRTAGIQEEDLLTNTTIVVGMEEKEESSESDDYGPEEDDDVLPAEEATAEAEIGD
mmetsp:Transcript_21878/g.54086  ORF Transcript_21878/g.54086 Transcript_21878/m.54086 type:complete len:361 (-) Transcript_21878:420-1502(-)